MSLPIEKWVRQALRKDRGRLATSSPSPRLLADINELMEYQRQFWHGRNNELALSGEPIALLGGFAGMPAVPPSAPLGTVTTAAGTTTALWTSSIHTPINANSVQAPQAYRLAASGTLTTVGTPGTGGFDPRVGTGSTINTAISGTTMGAISGVTLTASITNAFWRCEGDLTIRSIGTPGANSPCYFIGTVGWTNAAGPAVKTNDYLFGGTQASVDLSIAAGFSLGFVASAISNTLVSQQVHWASWN